MNPGVLIKAGGGAGGGAGAGGGKGKGGKKGANPSNGEEGAADGKKNAAGSCGAPGQDGGECPNHHGGKQSGSMAQGDPVDVATGKVFTLPSQDVALPGPLPLRFERVYSSAARGVDVGFGRGWTHSFAWQLQVSRRTTTLLTPHGALIELATPTPEAAMLGPNGWVLHKSDGGYVLDLAQGTSRIFSCIDGSDRTYDLSAVTDRHGNTHSLAYVRGKLSTIIDSVGREVRLRRDAAGRIAHIAVAPEPGHGEIVFAEYDYDATGELVAVRDADGGRTGYTYDERGLLLRYQRPIGITFHFRYDAGGRCVETWGEYPDGVDPCLAAELPPRLSDSSVAAKGIHHAVFEYDDEGYTEVVDAITHHRYFSNDAGKVEKAVSAGNVYSRTYDQYGHLASFTDAVGATTHWERDPFGNELVETDALGNTTYIERLPNGDITRITHPDGGTTNVTYGAGSMVWTDPIGARFEVRYDARGLLESRRAPNGVNFRYSYDRHGNLTHKFEGQTLRRALSYDLLGRIVSETDAHGNVTTYGLSTLGRVLTVRGADGGTWTYDRDGEGNVVRQIDPEGRATELVRGGTGNIADARLPDGTTVRLRYDRKERLVEVHNAAGDVYRIERDLVGMPTREVTFDGREITRRYDPANRVQRVVRGGASVEFTRDLLGRIVRKTYEDGSEERFAYDQRGALIAASTPETDVRIERNAVGWITRETQTLQDRSFCVDFEYDGSGRTIRRSTSLGHELSWLRNDETRTTSLLLDRTTRVDIRRDALGLELERTFAGGGRVEFAYDDMLRLKRQCVVAAPDDARNVNSAEPHTISAQLEYTYGSSSELIEVYDSRWGSTRFEHDLLGQLIAVRSADSTERYAYDAARDLYELMDAGAEPSRGYGPGNRLERRGNTDYEYDAFGRLIAKRESNANGAARVTHYAWDAKSQLKRVTLPTGAQVDFVYDALGRRVEKRVSEPVARNAAPEAAVAVLRRTTFVWAKDNLVHEVIADVKTADEGLRTYCFDARGSAFAQRYATLGVPAGNLNDNWYFHINDATSRPVKLINERGEICCDLAWSAWGHAEARPGATVTTPVRWNGQYADEETGLYYNRHRYYSPDSGRYISPDPMELSAGLNAYGYVDNQPTEYIDPLGLSGVRTQILDRDLNPVMGRDGKPLEGGSIGGMMTGASPPELDPSLAQDEKDPSRPAKRCAEREALSKMASDIRADVDKEQEAEAARRRGDPTHKPMTDDEKNDEIRRRLKQRFDDEGLRLETTEDGKRVDPCKKCGIMIKQLGIGGSVVGRGGKKGKFGVY